MSYGQRKCAKDELLSYFQVEAQIHRPSFFLFFSLMIKDKTKISLTIKILHLGQGSFTRKVRTIFSLKIIVSIFVKLFLILVLHLWKGLVLYFTFPLFFHDVGLLCIYVFIMILSTFHWMDNLFTVSDLSHTF